MYLNEEKIGTFFLCVCFFPQQALERAGVGPANENKNGAKPSRSSCERSVEVALEAAAAGQQMQEPADLTGGQLLVRRGLSLLLMVIVLAAAISVAQLLAA